MMTCRMCGKSCFSTRKRARRAARLISPGQRWRVYKHGDYWHLTSADAETTTMLRERDQEPAR